MLIENIQVLFLCFCSSGWELGLPLHVPLAYFRRKEKKTIYVFFFPFMNKSFMKVGLWMVS